MGCRFVSLLGLKRTVTGLGVLSGAGCARSRIVRLRGAGGAYEICQIHKERHEDVS